MLKDQEEDELTFVHRLRNRRENESSKQVLVFSIEM